MVDTDYRLIIGATLTKTLQRNVEGYRYNDDNNTMELLL